MPRLSTLAGALALALAGAPLAQAQSFSNIIGFGDSLTDAGQFVGIVPGVKGSFTTNPDPIWLELVGANYGFVVTPSNFGGFDYAYGGAQTHDPVPGIPSPFCVTSIPGGLPCLSMTTQLGYYFASTGGVADPNALYSVWGGANDLFFNAFRTGLPTLHPLYITSGQAQANMQGSALVEVGLIAALQSGGARYILVFNLPDVGRTPDAIAAGPAAVAGASGLSFVFNSTLDAGLATLGDGIIPINTYGLINEILASPGDYGLGNTTDHACLLDLSVSFCDASTLVAPDANNTYLFADGSHPSGAAHRLLAPVVIATIAAPGQVSLVGELPLQVYDDHSGVINGQLFANRRSDRSNGEANTYANLQFGKQKFDAATNTGAMDLNQFTATFGADYMAAGNIALGGAISFGNSNGSTGGAGLHSREVLASAYAAVNFGDVGYIDAIASVGSNNVDVNRGIELGPTTRIDSGTTTAKDVAFELGGGLAFGTDDFKHGPFASVAWQKVTVDGYAEENTDSTSMWFSGFERKSLVGRIGYQLQGTSGSFRPYVRIDYAKEDKNDVTQVQAGSNSMNGHFTMPGFAPSSHWGEADVGVRYSANDSTELVFNYRGRFSDNTQSRDAVSFMVRKTF